MGLTTSTAIGVRGKFLARALFLFLRYRHTCKLFSRHYCELSRVLLTEDRTQLVERTLEESEGGREQLLGLAEVKPHVDKVTSLKRDKGMAGIHDLIDWTLAQVRSFASKVYIVVSLLCFRYGMAATALQMHISSLTTLLSISCIWTSSYRTEQDQ